jgi:hypothetical protein
MAMKPQCGGDLSQMHDLPLNRIVRPGSTKSTNKSFQLHKGASPLHMPMTFASCTQEGAY